MYSPLLRTENVQNHVCISFSAWILPASPVRDVTRSFPAYCRPGERSLYLSGVLRVGDPVLYVIYCHFCTKYELICSFNTFCTCRHPYYVQKTYKTTYEFHFQLAFSLRVRSVTSLRSSLAARRPGEHSLYLSGVLRGGDPVWYIIYCLFRTEYELICSVNTFCMCICSYYVQKTYKTTYEFHFQLGFSQRVQAVTSSQSFPASRWPRERSLYISGVLRGRDPVLYVIYCHLCTKYELICSFNTF